MPNLHGESGRAAHETFSAKYGGSDTVTINVYTDSCRAAQSLPRYQPLVGDLNGDGKVGDTDPAMLQEDRLEGNSLIAEWFRF